MNKGTKLTIIIVIFSFSIQLLIIEKSYQSIFPNIDEENNNNNYVSNVEIIEKNIEKESKTNEIKFAGEQEKEKDQVPIKPSELKNNIDGKILIENEMK